MKTIALITSAVLYLFLSFSVYAQDPAYKNYSTSDGLASNNVYSTIQDNDGFIWFATDNGVSRFDGTHFRNFSTSDGLPSRNILQIKKDCYGRLWFFSFNGKISIYDKGEIFNATNNNLLKKLFLNSTVGSFFQDSKKNIWLSYLNHTTIRISASGAIKMYTRCLGRYFWEDKEGNVKMISNDGVFTFHDTLISHEPIIPAINVGQAMLLPGDSLLLIAGGIEKTLMATINLNTNTRTEINNSGKYNAIVIRNLGADNKKNIWVSTLTGVMKFEGGKVSPEYESDYYQNLSFTNVYQDKDNNYWFTSIGSGVFMVPSMKTILFNSNSGLVENDVSSILLLADSTMMIGTQNGAIQLIDHHEVKQKNHSITPPKGSILKIARDSNNNIWVLTDIAILRYNKGGFTKLKDYSFSYKTIFVAHDKTIWIGFGAGLKKVIGDSIETVYYQGLNRIYSIAEINNNELWLGTDKGLYCFKNGKMIDETNEDSLLSGRINALSFSDDSTLWMATDENGLLSMKKNGEIKHYSVKDGLLSNYCNSLLIDDEKIYLATDKGLNILSFQNNGLQINSYSSANGLVCSRINQIIKKSENVFLLATDKGIIEFDIRTLSSNSISKPYINEVFVNDNNLSISDLSELRYNENNLQIDFGAIDFNAVGNSTGFYYKLLGLDTSWNYTTSNSVKYNRLPPGKYSFIVKTNKNPLGANVQTASFSLFIQTPVWQTWWFRLLAGMGVILIIVMFVRNRVNAYVNKINQQRNAAESELRALRAQINPHFIYNSLNSIQDFIMQNQKEDANIYLSKFATLMRNILTHSRSAEITLAEEIASLRLYLELESLVSNGQFSYHLDIDEHINPEEIKIPSMILQPYIENAILHGLATVQHGGQIKISFQGKGPLLQCVIEDNGIGRTKAAELKQQKVWKNRPSLGMQVTQERIDLISIHKGKKINLEIVDLIDEKNNVTGTRVNISFHLETMY